MSVYILHLNKPLKHARHYVGYAQFVEERLAHHRNGSGARFTQVCNEQGIWYELARVFEGADRTFERKLKNTHKVAPYCPICNARPRDYQPRKE